MFCEGWSDNEVCQGQYLGLLQSRLFQRRGSLLLDPQPSGTGPLGFHLPLVTLQLWLLSASGRCLGVAMRKVRLGCVHPAMSWSWAWRQAFPPGLEASWSVWWVASQRSVSVRTSLQPTLDPRTSLVFSSAELSNHWVSPHLCGLWRQAWWLARLDCARSCPSLGVAHGWGAGAKRPWHT